MCVWLKRSKVGKGGGGGGGGGPPPPPPAAPVLPRYDFSYGF